MKMDDVIEKLMAEQPLSAFSIYTHLQIETLLELGEEIKTLLDDSIGNDAIGPEYRRAYGLFWLWVLGAYEVVRTMCQAQECFSGGSFIRLKEFKSHIAELRMPFAKQEYQGRKVPIYGENSITSFDKASRDILFNVKGKPFGIRQVIERFENLIHSIKRCDVLKDHRDAY